MARTWTLFLAIGIAALATGCGEIRRLRKPPAERHLTPPEEQTDVADTSDSVAVTRACKARLDQARPLTAVQIPPRPIEDGAYLWDTYPFEMTVEGDRIVASITLGFDYLPENDTSVEALRARTIQTLPCMEQFFTRHGIGFQIREEDASQSRVAIRPNGERPSKFNAWNWALSLDGQSLDDESLCSVFSHELGHLLGLKDEYEDVLAPARKLGERDSIMRYSYGRPERLKLYPRHMDTLLAGLCPQP